MSTDSNGADQAQSQSESGVEASESESDSEPTTLNPDNIVQSILNECCEGKPQFQDYVLNALAGRGLDSDWSDSDSESASRDKPRRRVPEPDSPQRRITGLLCPSNPASSSSSPRVQPQFEVKVVMGSHGPPQTSKIYSCWAFFLKLLDV